MLNEISTSQVAFKSIEDDMNELVSKYEQDKMQIEY